MAQAMVMPKKYFFDRNGRPLAFGKVYTYQAGTNINQETFQSEAGDAANTNPIILNGEGYADIYLNGSYRIVVKDKNDNEIWSADPVSSPGYRLDTYKTFLIANGYSGDYGFFEDGFEYVNTGDVGISENNEIFVYVGPGAPVKTVAPGTIPSSPDYKSINFTYSFDSVQNMLNEIPPIKGGKYSTGATKWLVNDISGIPLQGTSPQLYVRALNGWWLEDFGLIPDDESAGEDNFNTLNYVSTLIHDNITLNFSGNINYLAHTLPYDINYINGRTALAIKSNENVTVNGNGTRVKVTDHDISLYNHLTVISHDAVQTLDVNGFIFDLSYVGRNNSEFYYPQGGAVIGKDTLGSPGTRTFDQLSSDTKVNNNRFKIFHPEGCYGKAANPFATDGDPNNGFKNYSYTFLGDNAAVDLERQNNDCEFMHNTFLKGHNAYGVWVWAVGNFTADHNTASYWIAGVTDSTGAWQGFASIPMIRYIKFYTTGATIGAGNRCVSLETSKRVGAFQGAAIYCHVTDNMAVDTDVGGVTKADGYMKMGTGDVGILVGVYGTAHIQGDFESWGVDDRPTAAIDIQPFEGGNAEYHIRNVSVCKNFSGPTVRGDVGSTTAAKRRLKKITMQGISSGNCLASPIFFVNNRGNPVFGVDNLSVSGCVIDGRLSQFDMGNTNKVAVDANLFTEASDIVNIVDNEVRGFYNLERTGLATARVEGNYGSQVTASQSYNYLAAPEQEVSAVTVLSGNIPIVGTSNSDLFDYTAKRVDNSTGVVVQFTAGRVAGGSSLAGATPAGQSWYISQKLIAKKGF